MGTQQKGFLQVSTTHKINYEVCGNQNGDAILFVHGGPGFGYSERDKRFFNFDKQKVIFFDQRGASKSIPFGSIEENTTQDLVNDINALLDYLKISSVILFGGSWGSFLSLVYAIQNPNRVKGLLLRGLFLGNEDSVNHFLNGGVKEFYPTHWKRFKNNTLNDNGLSIAQFYLDKMINGNPQEKKYYAYEWAFYEISIFKKYITEKEVDEILNQIPYESLSILEAHYLSNNCFVEEGYVLNNINKIEHISTFIIHGNEDVICPLKFAIELDSKLKNSKLFVVDAGHSDSEPEIEKKLVEIINTCF